MATTDHIQGLPSEMLLEIASYLDQKDLLRCALASQTLRNVAQIVLFDTIRIEGYMGSRRLLYFLNALLDRPDLAQKTMCFHLWQGGSYHECNEAVAQSPDLPERSTLDETALHRKIFQWGPNFDLKIYET
jgi:hypothetical protein